MHPKFQYLLLLLGLASCSMPENNKVDAVLKQADTFSLESDKQYNATSDTTLLQPLPQAPTVRRPKGIYRTVLPLEGGLEQTIAFYSNGNYRLQEKYAKRDSIVISEGTWSPSDGSIWIYKDQVVRGRYRWNGDTLQYLSPFYKKSFSLQPLQAARDNGAWQSRSGESLVLFGSGPSWQLTLTDRDTLSLLLPAHDQPIQFRVAAIPGNRDSVAYTGSGDSTGLRVIVYREFCGDGASDLVYRNRVRVEFNNQVYNGCGILYR